MNDYDEFGLFHENIIEFDLDVAELPPVVRVETTVADDGGTRLSKARSTPITDLYHTENAL